MIYQQEPLKAAIPEIEAVLPAHFESASVALFPSPNWAVYLTLEQLDKCCFLTARENEHLVGYMLVFFHPSVNSVTVQVASIPTYYVRPHKQRAFILRRLFGLALKEARKHDCSQVKARTEFHNSCGQLLEAMGFLPEEIGYKLELAITPAETLGGLHA